ncbi:MAG: ribbon-helix-helix protein, CopG family [Actinobacteria bacterium]|nr:ribbon-helix-helix protein, CopG family [Actinomycetota bacterium]
MALKKTTLLFEEQAYKKLQEKSKLEKTSVGELVREAVTNYYGIKSSKEKMDALQKLGSLNMPVSDYKEMEKDIIKELFKPF